ncbi:olfactory receptor 52K1-like [Channa argus]|uniref:olfactory receptor 52K1-like n=1 Tax=Channa argus TaxID=215402 RepID=UPI00351F8167
MYLLFLSSEGVNQTESIKVLTLVQPGQVGVGIVGGQLMCLEMITKELQSSSFSHRHFILNGFNELQTLRPVLFLPFSIMFILSLSANSLLLYVVISQRSLHSPMYILIAGMAFVDLSLPLVFVPNMLLSFLFDWRGISLNGCLFQMYFIHFVGAFQSTLLGWMALDRYFAICRPLYYNECMALPKFLKFVIPLLIRNVFLVMVVVILAGRLTFCLSNVIEGCFCEHMALVELACGSTAINSLVGLISVFLVIVVDFLFTLTSYIIIFTSVLSSGISSAKALHTCVTHIVVISVSLVIVLTAFLSFRIRNNFPAAIRVFVSTMYPLFPSCFNPIIYGIRTKEIRQQILKILTCHFVKTVPQTLETNKNE